MKVGGVSCRLGGEEEGDGKTVGWFSACFIRALILVFAMRCMIGTGTGGGRQLTYGTMFGPGAEERSQLGVHGNVQPYQP